MSTNLTTAEGLDIEAWADHDGTIHFQFDHAAIHTKSANVHEFLGSWSEVAVKEYIQDGKMSNAYWSRPSLRHGLKGSDSASMREVHDWGRSGKNWGWLWKKVYGDIFPTLGAYFRSDDYKRDLQEAQQRYYRAQIMNFTNKINISQRDIERYEGKLANFRALLIGDE
jgi:hypothetical protein